MDVLCFVSITQHALELDSARHSRYELCSSTLQKFSSTKVLKSSLFSMFLPKIPSRIRENKFIKTGYVSEKFWVYKPVSTINKTT